MANPKPHTVEQSATERLDAARSVKQDAITRELAWVAIVCRAGIWPAWISQPAKRQTGLPYLLNIESPAGRLVYRIAEEEIAMFELLAERPNDGEACDKSDKMARLLHLATEGW